MYALKVNQNPVLFFCSLFEAHCHIKPLMKTKTTKHSICSIGLQPFYLELAFKSDHFQAQWLIKINGHSGNPNYMHLTTFYHIFWNLPKMEQSLYGNGGWQQSFSVQQFNWPFRLSLIYLSWSIDSTVSFTRLVNVIMHSASQGRRKQFLEIETVTDSSVIDSHFHFSY